jgi:hypothetical protein
MLCLIKKTFLLIYINPLGIIIKFNSSMDIFDTNSKIINLPTTIIYSSLIKM